MPFLIVITILFSFLLFPDVSFGCSCHPMPASATEAYAKASLVVLGKVIEVNAPSKGGQYKFVTSVEKSWKASTEKEVVLSTNIHGFSCGIGKLNVGDEFLFYAWKWPEQKHYMVGSCNRFLPKSKAAADIDILNSISSSNAQK